MKWTANTLSDLDYIATAIWDLIKDRKVVAFYGEMGAGKTTLIKVICKAAGVLEATSSPTFSIVNEYHSQENKIIYHFDFYRLKDATEALQIGVEEYFSSGGICLIEWPEKIDNLLPSDCVKVQIEMKQDTTRIISLTA